jgi:hypothetical protein
MADTKRSKTGMVHPVQKERTDFHKLIATNPNYFGNIKGSPFKAVLPILNNTSFEEVTCIGFNPNTNVLEAVIQIKLPTGYSGDPCQSGSFEYIRFFLNYGSGWEDQGLAAVHVHDIPNQEDCAKAIEKPLSYAVSVMIQPKANWCGIPVLPQARAILSWQMIPTAGDPTFSPIWGNSLDCHVQIRPRPIFFSEVAASISETVKKVIPPEQIATVGTLPIPLPDPPPFELPELAKLYAPGPAAARKGVAVKAAVPSHRFGFAELVRAIQAPVANSELVSAGIAKWKSLGLDWQAAIAALADVNANVSFEQLECLGLEGDTGLERLAATLRIKQPTGYGGGLCTAGSTEYVAFWADWDDTCAYSYLGTVPLQVHDISAIPGDGLCYEVTLPVDLSTHRAPCDKPKVGRVRAVLSWAVPPSTTDPDELPFWGNRIDAHVQIQPGTIPNPLNPTISILGGIPTSQIDGSGVTILNAHFAGNNLLADAFGRQCPFGGRVEIQGPEFHGFKYRIQVRPLAGGLWQNVVTPLLLTRSDGTVFLSSPDGSGFFEYQKYENNIENLLGEWDTGGDDQWLVKLEIADMFDNPIVGAIPDIHILQLDNTAPVAQVHIDSGGDCGKFAVGAVLNGHFVARDLNFGSYSLFTEPFLGPISPSGGTVQTVPAPGDAWILNTATMKPCGYVTQLDVADRSIVNSAWGSHNTAPASAGFCLLATL